MAQAGPGSSPYYSPGQFEPGPVEVTWQIWVGFIISVVPFVIASYEFGKRILIQLRCERCNGSGLLNSGPSGKFKRKCPECGGQ